MLDHGMQLKTARYHLFDTDLGTCGLAWSEDGLTRLQLPERDRCVTEARLRGRSSTSAAPDLPPAIKHLTATLQGYFAGRRCEFRDVELDLATVGAFYRAIYDATRRLGWGQIASYGELAAVVGSPGSARAVGQAMARNPVPIIIPCHRVLASGRKVGGFSAYGGALTKERLLRLEGVSLIAEAPLLAALEQPAIKP